MLNKKDEIELDENDALGIKDRLLLMANIRTKYSDQAFAMMACYLRSIIQ